jgi:hypothetical protein
MEISWEPIDIPAKVYDYEVELSSTAGNGAPNIMGFQSTKQHAHHRVRHGNIPDATLFYIIIKTISKSNVQGLTVSTEICPIRVPYIMLFKPLTLGFFHGPLTMLKLGNKECYEMFF